VQHVFAASRPVRLMVTVLDVPHALPVCTAEKSHLYYGDVEVVVLDEADTMFDRGFGPEVGALVPVPVCRGQQPAASSRGISTSCRA
jgi:hypothetical protein